jgi:hypothetical protein
MDTFATNTKLIRQKREKLRNEIKGKLNKPNGFLKGEKTDNDLP